jgi:hypothetical protein
MELTIEDMAKRFARSEEATAEFINSKAEKLYFAKYSTGAYGRIFLPLIRKIYAGVNLNGQSTRLALAITGEMKALGYDYVCEDKTVHFRKVEK